MTRLILESGDYYLERNFVILRGMVRVNELEKAPLKTWRPYCFSDYNLDGKCDCEEYYMMASCDKCPYRDVAKHQQKGQVKE